MVRPTYTRVDEQGLQWRMEGARPVSELADMMKMPDGFPPIWWTTGRRCKLRLHPEGHWFPGEIAFASSNGLNICVSMEPLQPLPVISIMPRDFKEGPVDVKAGSQVIMLMWDPVANAWEDIVTLTKFDVGVRP